MEAVAYIVEKYGLTLHTKRETEIPDMGRDDLPELFCELGFERGAEIGTERGLYAERLCAAGLQLYAIDAWTTYLGYYEDASQTTLDGAYAEAKQRLQPYDCELIRAYSMDAVERFGDASLDFVYIDGNHMLPWVIQDICAWRRKVRPGGIIAGHDYHESNEKHKTNHVVCAVHCAIQAYRIKPWFIVGTKDKTPGRIRDRMRSWFWVNE